MGILQNIRDLFSSDQWVNKTAAIVAGFLFFAGWWIIIDAMSGDSKHQLTTGHVFIGIFGTISFCMINIVRADQISDNNSEWGARNAKIALLLGFIMGFASIIAAIWVMISDFINNDKKETHLGISLLLQNVFILFGSLVYKFGRNADQWNE